MWCVHVGGAVPPPPRRPSPSSSLPSPCSALCIIRANVLSAGVLNFIDGPRGLLVFTSRFVIFAFPLAFGVFVFGLLLVGLRFPAFCLLPSDVLPSIRPRFLPSVSVAARGGDGGGGGVDGLAALFLPLSVSFCAALSPSGLGGVVALTPCLCCFLVPSLASVSRLRCRVVPCMPSVSALLPLSRLLCRVLGGPSCPAFVSPSSLAPPAACCALDPGLSVSLPTGRCYPHRPNTGAGPQASS